MNPLTLGFVGGGTIDYYAPDAQIIAGVPPAFYVESGAVRFPFVSAERVEAGAKISVAALPPALLGAATEIMPGGGALNSLRAFTEIAPGVRARYLDACEWHERLASQCAALGTDSRYLGLYPVPCNLIIGMDQQDKVILKSVPCRTSGLNGHSAHSFQWLAECQAVLLNSSRPVGLVSQVINLQARTGLRLHAAITRSLPSAFVLRTVLPAASTVYANWDEVDAITNFPVTRSLRDATKGLRWLKRFAPHAAVFLTMGSRGVLVSPSDSPTIFHVCLKRTVAEAVRLRVAADPSRVCGCGDSFVAGAVAAVETGCSLLAGFAGGAPGVFVALSGCAAALRHLGYNVRLAANDFLVRRMA